MASRKRKYTFRRYTVPDYIHAALETLRPPDDITVSQWALAETSRRPRGRYSDSSRFCTGSKMDVMDGRASWAPVNVIPFQMTSPR